jgi:VWFA-related protein
MRSAMVVAVLTGTLTLSVAAAQTVPDAGTSPSPIYTLGSTTRLVIEDVLVTDKAGNAVKGLPASAFSVADDGVPQKVLDFSEIDGVEKGSGTPEPAVKGVYSNVAMQNGSGRLIVLLLDSVATELQDQIYMRLQILKYIKTMPEGLQVAVFRNNGMGKPLLVQSFTTDHALLVKAVNNSIPAIPRPVLTSFTDAVSEVATISYYLAQIPGRKQLIWFSGKFPLFESALGLANNVNLASDNDDLKLAYRLLEKARVEVFPVDVRGVTMGGPPLNQPADPGGAATHSMPIDASRTGISVAGDSAEDGLGYSAMDQMAASTGGKAFYSENDLTKAIARAVSLGDDSYALTYHPRPYQPNGHWHRVMLKVNGPYKLSYRRGYFADERPGAPRDLDGANERQKKALLAVQTAVETPPISFEATLQPLAAEPPKGSSTFNVHFGITSKDVEFTDGTDGKQEAQFEVAAIAYDRDGHVVSSALQEMKAHFSPSQMEAVGKVGIPVDQKITIGKKATYLLLAVVDQKSGRTGTVQLTMDTAKNEE